ncbi:ty3-gypsy retrotransposon protein [Cucumis melo var. makuwa]|uniref:Ty3-gypsy retrotransposon protein n=1 Tax=Cucumis melo var. makuwa TaxID=1194695 RepID=A0A5D3D2M6_CUCMM|nr:ty3-gypsy retrotransposon protein [Cucumis melo var. makuwa]TYK17930.1 ty3-gypsy retrotransposon protein [Cucumis melo var. makuwa]
MTSQDITFKALNDINKWPNTCSCSRETQSSKDMPPFEIEKHVWEQISKPLKSGVVIKENLMTDEHNSSSEHSNEEVPHLNIMLVMVNDVDTSEDKMVKLEKKVTMLIKAVEKRDFEIALLKNHIKSRDVAESSHTHCQEC